MLLKRATREELQAQIGDWNRRYKIGTSVRSQLFPTKTLHTRTEATLLFDQRPVVYLEGYNGYFDLNEITAEVEQRGPAFKQEERAGSSNAPNPPSPASGTRIGKRSVIVFPGQGAQNLGMGSELFADFPDLTRRANDILGYSIEDLCLRDLEQRLNLTQYTQVALYVVNALGYMKRGDRQSPDYLMGHSLGEYNALLAADVFDFETGLRLVMKRGELMGAASGGAMAAVLGMDPDSLRDTLARMGLDGIDLANFNTPSQTVISGPADEIGRAVEQFTTENLMIVPLKVSAAFHSRYMQEAQQSFAEYLQYFHLHPPQRTVIANATALPYEAHSVAETLSSQIVSPVLWTDSVRYLLGAGEAEFTEIGSTILTKMIREIGAARNT